MTRHSRHSNDRSFFSYKERKDAGYAVTKKDVLGTDCFLPFGFCALSLKAPKDPVSTPDGYIYEREHILEFLLTRKMQLEAEQRKYENQEKRKAQKLKAEMQEAHLKEIEDFQKSEQSVLSDDHRHKRALDKAAAEDGREDEATKRRRRGELIHVSKSQQAGTSFWARNTTPTAAPSEVKKVDTTVRCPMSGKKLRVKDLIPVKFEVADPDLLKQGGARGVFCCAVSKRPITHQQAVLLKPSGQVVLESVLKDCVYPSMSCPVTGSKLGGKEDILKLQMGGTGFSAHNDVEAKVYSEIRNRSGDDRSLQGHLPRAGYCGLR